MTEIQLAIVVAGFFVTLAFNSWGVIAFLMNKIDGVRKDMVTRQEYERDSQNTHNELRTMRTEINQKFDMLFTVLINGKRND